MFINLLANAGIRKIYYIKAHIEMPVFWEKNGENFVEADLLLLAANLTITSFFDQSTY